MDPQTATPYLRSDTDNDSDIESSADSDTDFSDLDEYDLPDWHDLFFSKKQAEFNALLVELSTYKYINEKAELLDQLYELAQVAVEYESWAENNNIDIYTRLLEVYRKLNISVDLILGNTGRNLWQHACENDWDKLLDKIIEQGEADFNLTTTQRETVWELKLSGRIKRKLLQLIAEGKIEADPNRYDKKKNRHLLKDEILQFADISTFHSDLDGVLPDDLFEDLHELPDDNTTPLCQSAQEEDHYRADTLLAAGARPQNIVKIGGEKRRAKDFAPAGSSIEKKLHYDGDDLSDNASSDNESDSDSEIERYTAIGLRRDAHNNKANTNNGSENETIPFSGLTAVIPFFRGIHTLRDIKNPTKQRQTYKNLLSRTQPLYADFVHAICKIPRDKAFFGTQELAKLDGEAQNVIDFWNNILKKPITIPKPAGTRIGRKEFACMADYIQHRASNTATRHNACIWEDEIWPHIRRHKAALLTTLEERTKYKAFFEPDCPSKSLFICTGKTPQKAICYTLGKSVTLINRPLRTDVRARRDGKAKYPFQGILYIKLMPYAEYQQTTLSDTGQLSHHGNIDHNPRYRSETEVAFLGKITHEMITIPIMFPSFHLNWSRDFEAKFGLTKDQYKIFQQRLNGLRRPDVETPSNIFILRWNTIYKHRYGITEKTFIAHQDLLKDLGEGNYQSFRRLFTKHKDAFSIDELNEYKSRPGLTREKVIEYLKSETHLRRTHEYRRFKEELRSHLTNFYTDKALAACHEYAREQKKVLAYVDNTGALVKYGEDASQVKKTLTATKRLTSTNHPLLLTAPQTREASPNTPAANSGENQPSSALLRRPPRPKNS